MLKFTHHILTSMSNTDDKIRVGKYFSQLAYERTSCRVENASHLCTKAKIRQEPREGTSALHTLCMPRSLSKNPT